MSLRYFKFDCTDLTASEKSHVIDFLDGYAATSSICNPQKYPGIYFGFIENVENLKHYVDVDPVLKKCTISEAIPD